MKPSSAKSNSTPKREALIALHLTVSHRCVDLFGRDECGILSLRLFLPSQAQELVVAHDVRCKTWKCGISPDSLRELHIVITDWHE